MTKEELTVKDKNGKDVKETHQMYSGIEEALNDMGIAACVDILNKDRRNRIKGKMKRGTSEFAELRLLVRDKLEPLVKRHLLDPEVAKELAGV